MEMGEMTCDEFTSVVQIDPWNRSTEDRISGAIHARECQRCRRSVPRFEADLTAKERAQVRRIASARNEQRLMEFRELAGKESSHA